MYVTPTNTAATAKATIQNGAVTKITVTGIGANYNSTPVVVVSGGRTDGSTPTDTAKAYANLNNDLVRDLDTTIKFDRVSSTSRVQDWTASTAYAIRICLVGSEMCIRDRYCRFGCCRSVCWCYVHLE